MAWPASAARTSMPYPVAGASDRPCARWSRATSRRLGMRPAHRSERHVRPEQDMVWTEEVERALHGVPRTEQRRVGVDAFEVFEWRPGQAVLGLAEARTHGEPRRKVRDHARAVMRGHLQLGMAF